MSAREPCPLCGCSTISGVKDHRGAWLLCPSCGLDGPLRDTEAEALAAWNRRAPDPRVKALRGALQALVDGIERQRFEPMQAALEHAKNTLAAPEAAK